MVAWPLARRYPVFDNSYLVLSLPFSSINYSMVKCDCSSLIEAICEAEVGALSGFFPSATENSPSE